MKFIIYFYLIALPAFEYLAAQSDTLAAAAFDTIVSKDSGLVQSENKTIEDTTKENESIIKVGQDLAPPKAIKEKVTQIFSASKIIWSIIFFVIAYYIMKLISTILNKFSERSIRYRLTLKGLIPIIRIVGWTAIITFIVVAIFAPPVESLFVVTGSLGLAVGFASQDILKNIFGGIMVLFDRPFQVGDKIQIGSHYGEVLNIGLRSIRIVTADDSVVSIPNGELMNQSVSNSNSGAADCQVVAEIYLPAHIDVERARKIAIRSAQVSRYVYLKKPIAVIFKNEILQNRSVLKMRLKAYVLDIRYEFPFMSDMTEVTIRELLKNGIVNKEELSGLLHE